MDSCTDGEHLKKMIKHAGYTIKEFYQELGVAKSTFYYYRTGVRPIPRELRRRIEDLLQCPFHDFLVPEQETNLIMPPLAHQRRARQQ